MHLRTWYQALSTRHILVGTLLATVVGCGDHPTAPDAVSRVGAVRASAGNAAAASSADRLARGVALAMNDPAIRASVRDAMRASPWVEHKLLLQDFVATPEGLALVRAVAGATAQSVDDVLGEIRTLPPLDFYVPSRDDRLSWRGTDHITVAAAFGRDLSSVSGYDARGHGRVHAGRDRQPSTPVEGAPVLFLLQPAEAKGARLNPQIATRGDVTQDPGDGEIGVAWVSDHPVEAMRALRGTMPTQNQSSETTMVVPIDPCVNEPGVPMPPECELPPPPPPPPPSSPPIDTTYLVALGTNGVCDYYDCWQGNEFELKAYERTVAGQLLSDMKVRITGVPNLGWVFPNRVQIFREVNGDGRRLDIEAWETDDGPDDYFGFVRLLSAADRNAAKTFFPQGSVVATWTWTP